MKVRFKRISNDEHTLTVERRDGSVESVSCETRSYLEHDFIHFALESEAGFDDGFWGALAAGSTLDELNDRDGASRAPELEAQLMRVEKLVGVMTGLIKQGLTTESLDRVHSYLSQVGMDEPWLDLAAAEAVVARFRKLQGHWRATGFHEEMAVEWAGQ